MYGMSCIHRTLAKTGKLEGLEYERPLQGLHDQSEIVDGDHLMHKAMSHKMYGRIRPCCVQFLKWLCAKQFAFR